MFIKNALVTKQIMPNGYRLLCPGETMAKLNEALLDQNLSHELGCDSEKVGPVLPVW